MKIAKRILSMCLVIILALGCVAFAEDEGRLITVLVDGKQINFDVNPILDNGRTLVPMRFIFEALGATVGWDDATQTATAVKGDITISITINKPELVKNGNVIVLDVPAKLVNDRTLVPVRAVSETLGFDVSWDDFNLTVKIVADNVNVSEVCKDKSYTYEDILYIGKIIQIECGYSPFEVKLGVAGTIVNRMKSSAFPNTIKEVIFDTKYGVQFPPAHTDMINRTPTKESIIAGKCALNGVNIVGNSLYFIETRNAVSSWAHKNRPYYTNIGSMSFYE